MNYKNGMSIVEYVLTIFVVLPLSIILSGLVIRYGWNNILATIQGVPDITLIQAIGIDVLASFIIARNEQGTGEDNFATMLSKAIGTPLIVYLLLWIVTLFL